MRARNRIRAALLATALGAPPAHAPPLARTLPDGVPSPDTMAGWERADGEAADAGWAVVYSLYVNPQRPGLYEVTRFRVDRFERQGSGEARRVPETEKLLWNSRPGTREPLVCFERAPDRRWWTLWRRRWRWRPLTPGTPEYREAMLTAVRVYGLHRVRLGLPPPG
jgi:hypothetical protein